MPIRYPFLSLLVGSLFFQSCGSSNEQEPTLFELIPASRSGVTFKNELVYDEKFNPYTFRNFYNGAGVAVGDINNDGLLDIFFAGNQADNKLYLNKGNFQFEDITDQAGLAVSGIWSTGVSMVDINGDGLLDIYICKSGPLGGEERHNALYINNGDLTFTEMAEAYGIADEGLSQHAVFFDFDRDGDLDMYLLNNSARSVGINDLRTGQREIRDPLGGNKLYRNDGDHFVDVSEEAGIYGSAIGYGLGVTVSDVNQDGWPDLYVSNDFFEKDYLYLNNGDGTFTEALEEMMQEISMGSMGADIADLDNNGWPDIFVTEMLPATLDRVKTKTPFEDWDKYQANVKAGYFHQFTRNTLQRNLGRQPGSDRVHFIDVSRQTGLHATDWSWGALIFDADNDGLRDVFVANGIVKDLTDFDYVDYYVNNQNLIATYRKDSVLLTKLIDQFPSVPQPNFLFKNQGDFRFENIAPTAGLEQLTFSTGAVYADLDNDGDLDLIINNLNGEAFLYKNKSEVIYPENNYLQLDLGTRFGTKVMLYAGDQQFMSEHNPVKGYMSSVDPRMHFGLGPITKLDSVLIYWPNGKRTRMVNVAGNQLVQVSPQDSDSKWTDLYTLVDEGLYRPSSTTLAWKHEESNFVDFDRDRLRFHMISNEGPRIAVGDLNGDGLDDLCLPGAKGQASSIWLQQEDGSFRHSQDLSVPEAEDVQALFVDTNGDGVLDLYLASGSIEHGVGSMLYQDRLYRNDGSGQFIRIENALPSRSISTSFVRTLDYNGDGFPDLLVGGRSIPFAYGVPLDVQLLENDGKGGFSLLTGEKTAAWKDVGMTRDALVVDIDGDGAEEVILVGEWMPIRVFKWQNERFKDISEAAGFAKTSGLWNTVQVLDYTGNGYPDLFFGNHGLNSRLQASPEKPMCMHVNDFDQNGSIEQLITLYEGEDAYPLVLKGPLLRQLPALRKQLLTYEAYQDKRMEDLFPAEVLARSLVLQVETLEHHLFLNDGAGKFTRHKLPDILQAAPIYAIHVVPDSQELWLGGNQSRIKPELGTAMGSFGWVFSHQNPTAPRVLSAEESGLFVNGEIRDIQSIRSRNGNKIVIIRNNESGLVYEKVE
ncbi:MAG: VCBS repeat-containing protein [Nitritalea sp.]